MDSLVEKYTPNLPPVTEDSLLHLRVPGELMKEINDYRVWAANGGRQMPKAAPVALYFLALGIDAHKAQMRART